MIRSRLPWIFLALHGSNRKKLAMPHPIMSTSRYTIDFMLVVAALLADILL
jgi:hypothetical protein